jgi:uncharacterized protein
MEEHKYTNRLIHEKSPYLLQHAHNPVDWYPWSEEAFEKAKREDKPIFFSCGYSTCHWCHVMENESFEDSEVAAVLNKNFISIKVDREERPDIDHIYMTVCQTLTGHGGWPLTIFMTPEKKPFYAGTYYPKRDKMGMTGLISLLEKVTRVWNKDRDRLLESGEQIMNAIGEQQVASQDIDTDEIIREAYSNFKFSFDNVYGGFGKAPKFPTPHNLYFLLRYWYVYKEEAALEMVEKTLESMHKGGIFDHIAGGFSRYSTDKKWLVPHFEKMLYDNALLSIAYLETYQATKKEQYSEIAKKIFTYILRDMTSPEGGFYSAEDADSEGVEGKFYVWTPKEVKHILGEADGEEYCKHYDITDKGNFEKYNIPNLIKNTSEEFIPGSESDFVESCRKKLFTVREERIHPYKDDKILTSWNGLMIAALAMGGRVLGVEAYTKAAEKAVNFIFTKLVKEDGRLLARYRDGEAAIRGYVDDYAFAVWGLIELYETTYNPSYLQKAMKLNDDLVELFWDDEKGGLFIYGRDSEQLITRPKEIYDGATPSGNSVATLNFLRLARLTGRSELEEKAEVQFKTFGGSLEQVPSGHSFMLTALLFNMATTKEVVVVEGTEQPGSEEMLNLLKEDFKPFTLSLYSSERYKDLKEVIPFISNYKSVNGKSTAYVCENFSCQAPITSPGELKEVLS